MLGILSINSPRSHAYIKQFKISEANHIFIEQTMDVWLKLDVVNRSNSLYNSPLFCVPKKQGHGLRIILDFRQLNNHSLIVKYSMKESTECISDIGRANLSNFFPTQSHFWILAKKAGRKLITFDSIYHSGSRTIALGHITHGSVWLPSKISIFEGNSDQRN
jgi:hypothetical protein